VLGGVAGVLAMQLYWRAVTAIRGRDPREVRDDESHDWGPRELDSVSVAGSQRKNGESPAGAAVRRLYQAIAGQEPEPDTKSALSSGLRWLSSALLSGAYGAIKGRRQASDVSSGLRMGLGMWALGDETLLPVAGLRKGPTTNPPRFHAYTLGAYLTYGVASGLASKAASEILVGES
jgi:hypothetical protein